jgi:hypothetical protein
MKPFSFLILVAIATRLEGNSDFDRRSDFKLKRDQDTCSRTVCSSFILDEGKNHF